MALLLFICATEAEGKQAVRDHSSSCAEHSEAKAQSERGPHQLVVEDHRSDKKNQLLAAEKQKSCSPGETKMTRDCAHPVCKSAGHLWGHRVKSSLGLGLTKLRAEHKHHPCLKHPCRRRFTLPQPQPGPQQVEGMKGWVTSQMQQRGRRQVRYKIMMLKRLINSKC